MNTRIKKYLFSLLAAAISVVTCAQVFNPSGPIALVQTVPLTNAIYGRVGITNMVLIVRGDNVIGDGGGGVFSWLHSDTNAADNLRYFAATNGGNWYKLSYWYDGIGAGVFGVNNTFRSDWNAEDSSTVELLVSSVTNFSANVVSGSLTTNQISTNFYNWIDSQGSGSSLTINSTPATNIWSTGIIDFVDDGGGDFHAELGNESITTNKWAVSAYNWVLSLVSGGGTTNGLGVNGIFRTDWNAIDSAEIEYTVSSVTNYAPSIVAGSIATNKIDTTFYSWVESMAGGGGTNYTQFWYDLTNSLVASNNVTFAYDTGAQKLLISAVTAGASGTTVTVDGGSDLSRINHADGSEIAQTLAGTNLTASIVSGSIATNKIDTTFYEWVDSQSISNFETLSVGTLVLTNRLTTNVLTLADSPRVIGRTLGGAGVAQELTLTGAGTVSITTNASGFTFTGSGGGSSTNLLVNGTLITEANLIDSSNVVFQVSGSDISAYITNVAGSTTANVIQRIGYVNFVITNNNTQGDFTFTEYGGVITNINCTDCANDAPAQLDLSFSGLTHTNYFWSFNNEGAYPATTAVMAEIAGTRATSGLSLTIHDASGVVVFSDTSSYIWRFNLYQLVSVGGTGSGDVYQASNNVFTASNNFAGGSITVPTVTAGSSNNAAASTKYVDDAVESASSSSVFTNSLSQITLVDDLVGSTAAVGDEGVTGVANGGSVSYAGAEPRRPGMRQMGFSAVGAAPEFGWLRNSTTRPISLTNSEAHFFEVLVKTPTTLSQDAQAYEARGGFMASAGTTNAPTDGAFLRYDTNLVGGVNWSFSTISNTVPTTVDTGVLYSVDTWYRLGVRLTVTNAIGYINGTAVATNTATIPAYRSFEAACGFQRFVGTSGRIAYVDRFEYRWEGVSR